MYHQIMTTIIWIHIHDIIDDVTRSQNRSNFEIDISPSIFELQRRSKAQNVANAHGYLSGIFSFQYNFRKKVCRELKKAAILKYQTQLQFDLRYEKIVPHYAKKSFFYGDDVINDVTGWPQSFSLYSCLGEVGSGSKLQGQCLVNKCQYRNCLSRLYMPKDDRNEIHFSRLQVKGHHHRLTGWPWH